MTKISMASPGGNAGGGTSITDWSQVPKPTGGIPAADLATDVPTALAASSAFKGTYAPLQRVAATVTANATAPVNAHLPVDATAAAVTVTLPTGAAEGAQISVEKIDAGTNTVTLTGSIRGATASVSLAFQSESLLLRADSAGSWRPIAGHRTKSSLDSVYYRKPVGGIPPSDLNTLGTSSNPLTDAAAARPAGLGSVWWRTATVPTNLADNDFWMDAS